MRYRIDVDGIVEARKRLDGVGERARRPEPALRSDAMRRAFNANEERVFAGNRFPRNTRKWDARKRRKGLSSKRMQASGLLRRILTTAAYRQSVHWHAFNGVLTAGLKDGPHVAHYASALVKRDRKRRVVKATRRFRPDAAAIVERYVAHEVIT